MQNIGDKTQSISIHRSQSVSTFRQPPSTSQTTRGMRTKSIDAQVSRSISQSNFVPLMRHQLKTVLSNREFNADLGEFNQNIWIGQERPHQLVVQQRGNLAFLSQSQSNLGLSSGQQTVPVKKYMNETDGKHRISQIDFLTKRTYLKKAKQSLQRLRSAANPVAATNKLFTQQVAQLAPKLQPTLNLRDPARTPQIPASTQDDPTYLQIQLEHPSVKPVSLKQKIRQTQLGSLIDFFNKDKDNYTSIFVRLKHMLVNQPSEGYIERENLACSLLQYVVGLIAQEHIRTFLQQDILPTLYTSIFKDYKPTSNVPDTPQGQMSYDFVNKDSFLALYTEQKQKLKKTKQKYKDLQLNLKVNHNSIKVNDKLVSQVYQHKVTQRYYRMCFDALKHNLTESVSESVQVARKYLDQKRNYEMRHKLMFVVYRSFQVHTAWAKSQRQGKEIVELINERKTSFNQIGVLQAAQIADRDTIRLLRQKIETLNSEISNNGNQIASLRHELQGVKPAQVGALLRSYFQFLFGNPYFMRFKQHQISALPCSKDCFQNPKISIKSQMESDAFGDDQQVYLQHLLTDEEMLMKEGPGVLVLRSLGLDQYMQRWTGYLQTLCMQKLHDVIELYEDQIDIKNWQSKIYRGGHRNSIVKLTKTLPLQVQETLGMQVSDKRHLLETALKELTALKSFFTSLQNHNPSDFTRLLAILFVLDTSYRFVELDISSSVPFSVWKTDVVPDPSSQLKQFLNIETPAQDRGKLQIYAAQCSPQSQGSTGEVCFLPDLQPLLQILKTKEVTQLVQYAENLTHTSLQGLSYQNMILFLYMFNNQLTWPIQSSSKQSQSNAQQRNECHEIHGQISGWINLCLQPLIQRTKHQNIQDVTVLTDAQSPITDLLGLVNMPRAELLVRWVNYQVLKSVPKLKIAEEDAKSFVPPAQTEIGTDHHRGKVDPDRHSRKKEASRSPPKKKVIKQPLKNPKISKLSDLLDKDFSCLIVLLITLAPEVIFQQKNLYTKFIDEMNLSQLHVSMGFPNSYSADKIPVDKNEKIIFVMCAIEAITGKMCQLSFSDLYDLSGKHQEVLEDTICQLFLSRPFMPPHMRHSKMNQSTEYIENHLLLLSDYLAGYGRIEFNQIENHMLSINKSQAELISHFAVISDSETIYQQLRTRMAHRLQPRDDTYNAKPGQLDLFAQQSVLDLFKETRDKHEVINKTVIKFSVPLSSLIHATASDVQTTQQTNQTTMMFTYHAIGSILTKFGDFLDDSKIESQLIQISNHLADYSPVNYQTTQYDQKNARAESYVNTQGDLMTDIKLPKSAMAQQLQTQLLKSKSFTQINQFKSQQSQNLRQLQSDLKNPLQMASQQDLLQQRKTLYSIELKQHQLIAVLLTFCLNTTFLTNYLRDEVLQQDDSQFPSTGMMQKSYSNYSQLAQALFSQLTGQTLGKQQNSASKESLVVMMLAASLQKPVVILEYLLTNFLLGSTLFKSRLKALGYLRNTENQWLKEVGVPQLLQPLYDFYMYEQCYSMGAQDLKKFKNEPILLVNDGLRKFYEDFATTFTRVSKEEFFTLLVPVSKQSLSFFGFSVLIFKLSQYQYRYQSLEMTSGEMIRSFMVQIKNHAPIVIRPKAGESGNHASLNQSTGSDMLPLVIQHKRKLFLGIDHIKTTRAF